MNNTKINHNRDSNYTLIARHGDVFCAPRHNFAEGLFKAFKSWNSLIKTVNNVLYSVFHCVQPPTMLA